MPARWPRLPSGTARESVPHADRPSAPGARRPVKAGLVRAAEAAGVCPFRASNPRREHRPHVGLHLARPCCRDKSDRSVSTGPLDRIPGPETRRPPRPVPRLDAGAGDTRQRLPGGPDGPPGRERLSHRGHQTRAHSPPAPGTEPASPGRARWCADAGLRVPGALDLGTF